MTRTKTILGLVILTATLTMAANRQALSSDLGGDAAQSLEVGDRPIAPAENVCPWSYCAAPRTAAEEAAVPAPSGRFEFPGFSVAPPPGEGWITQSLEEARSLGFDILFRKSIARGETVDAYAVARRTATGLANPGEIVRAVVEQSIKPGSRSFTMSNDSLAGASCVRWEMVRKPGFASPGGQYGGKRTTLVSRYHGYSCSHPDAPAYVVEIGYIETVPKGIRRALVPEEGGSFLRALAFTRLGVHVAQFSAGRESRGVAVGYGAVWVTEEGAGVVSRIDPRTGATVARIPVGRHPEGFAVGLGAVWVPNWKSDTVSRIDPRTNEVVATIAVRPGPSDVAVGQGSVWVTSEKDRSVSRLDPGTNRASAIIHTEGRPVAIAAGDDAVWVENFQTNEIWRIDPKLNQVVATVRVGRGRHLIALDQDAVWVSNERDDSISRIDPVTNKVVATIAVGHGPMGLASASGSLWVANFGDSTLLRIDPHTNRIKGAPIPVGESPFFLSGNGRTLWMLSVWGHWDFSTLSRIDF